MGIKILGPNNVTVNHPAVWAGADEIPVVFLVIKEGSVGLADPDYVESELYDIEQGDITLADAWDFLLVKTPTLPYPQICRVRRLPGTGGGAEILVGDLIVHRILGVNR